MILPAKSMSKFLFLIVALFLFQISYAQKPEAEIEQLIISGLYRAFAEDREIGDIDIFSETNETVPLSITYKEHITVLRAWAETRARATS